MEKITTLDMEIALMAYYSPGTLVIPNVKHTIGIRHECDLLVMTDSNYAHEIEIKITKADLKADLKKKHGHRSNRIRKLYFALPEHLKDGIDIIPKRAGIFIVYTQKFSKGWWHEAIKTREAKINCKYKFTNVQRLDLAEKGCRRIFTLKRKLRAMQNKLQTILSPPEKEEKI